MYQQYVFIIFFEIIDILDIMIDVSKLIQKNKLSQKKKGYFLLRS